MDETSVGEALASAAYVRTCFEAALIGAGATDRVWQKAFHQRHVMGNLITSSS
jgi:hypothetical protein